MVKKKINKINQQKELSPSERHFGVVLEDIDSKLDLVVEGHQSLDKKIESLDRKTDKNHQEFQDFRNEVNYKFNEVNYKFEVVFEKFDDVTNELRVIRNELKEKVGRDEFVLLERRVLVLEKSRR